MQRQLTDEHVLRIGGHDPRYARVLIITSAPTVAVALVDTNGDEANIDGDLLHYEGGQWRAGSSSGPVGTEIGSYSLGEYADYLRYAYGRIDSAGRHTVTVQEWGRDLEVVAAAGGWWAWIETVDPRR